MNNIHVSCLMMVKNEQIRIKVTLDSLKGFVKSLIIYDTGSTDNTLRIIKQFSEENNILLRLKEGEFTNFSDSRNVSLDFADTFEDVDFLLLLDCNDEVRNGNKLLKLCEEHRETPNTSFLVCQQWFSGTTDKYYNVRLIKPRSGWRYRGVVHEYIAQIGDGDFKKEGDYQFKVLANSDSDFHLYQDRTKDDDKSGKRFVRDRALLLKEYDKNPTDCRTVFYLAQTCACLGNQDEAYYYYKLRSGMGGFQEEVFHSLLKTGDAAMALKHSWYDVMPWYVRAFEHSKRAEPLVKIVSYYRDKADWLMAMMFARTAIDLKYPDDCILFVDKKSYDYDRWHLTGIVGWYSGYKDIGEMACKRAIEASNLDIDKNNLKFYMAEKPKLPTTAKPTEKLTSKKLFIEHMISELRKQFPKLTEKQLFTKANLRWKLENSTN